MNDDDLVDLVDRKIGQDIFSSGTYRSDNEALFNRYKAEPYGDEEEGLSQILTTEVADTVDSDLVSLVRVFLGGGAPVEFVSDSSDQRAIQEAEDKNAFVKYILQNIKGGYRKQFDWLKEMEIQQMGWIEYGVEEKKTKKTKSRKGLTPIEAALYLDSLKKEQAEDEISIDFSQATKEAIDGGQEQTIDIEVEIIKKRKEYFIQNVPWEDFIISRNVQCKEDADVVGKRFRDTRGSVLAQLMAKGESKDEAKRKVDKLPKSGHDENDSIKSDRFSDQGGFSGDEISSEWASERVEGEDVYVLVDYDEDDIAERRRIVKFGKILLINEPFDHIPFAGGSVIPMPHNIVGRSRAEISCSQQQISTVFSRHISDNISAVNQGRAFIDSTKVQMDDYLNSAKHGAIRVKGTPSAVVLPDPVPYHGDKTLQVLAHFDSLQAKRTGQIITNQALTSDQLHKETATRFEGMQKAATGKIELVVRNIAEIAYRDLYEGIVWFAENFQDTALEFSILGKQFNIHPQSWEHDSRVQSMVGTGFDDDERTATTLTGVLALMDNEIQAQTGLSDNKKKYNLYKKLLRATGLHDVASYFNDPDVPAQQLFAENQILKQQVQVLQAQIENPLEGAEKVKQEGSIIRDQMKYNHERQMKAIDVNQDNLDRMQETYLKTAELELNHNTDLPGGI